MVRITLNQIKKHNPCESGWEKLLKSLPDNMPLDQPFDFEHIIESNGLLDSIWAFRCLDNKELVVRFAIKCAESVLHIFEEKYPNDMRPRKAIEAAKNWLDSPGLISLVDFADNACVAARSADYKKPARSAYTAARSAYTAAFAAYTAAYADNSGLAADAAGTVFDTAFDAVFDGYTERDKQKQFLLELLKEY